MNLFNKRVGYALILVILIIFAYEFIYLHPQQIIWLIIFGSISAFAWQRYYREGDRVLFWIGLIGGGLILLQTMFFRFVLLVPIIALGLYLLQNMLNQEGEKESLQFEKEPLEEKEVLYTNKWFGPQNVGEKTYEWQDIHLQRVFGDTVIDLNQTVLPKEEPLILLNQLAGTIKIIVPYDVEVSIHHSILIGSVDIFGYGHDQMTNRVIHYQTENYHQATQRIKIYTSMLIGKIEVSRR